jgi:hypothetical protein
MRIVALAVLFTSILLGCQRIQEDSPSNSASPNQAEGKIQLAADSTAEGAVRDYVSAAWCGEGLSEAVLTTALGIYRYENCSEILETLEVTDVRSAEGVTGAFIRYSIDTKVFRDVFWLRKINGKYARTIRDYPNTYSDDWGEEAQSLRKDADSWEEESAKWYD